MASRIVLFTTCLLLSVISSGGLAAKHQHCSDGQCAHSGRKHHQCDVCKKRCGSGCKLVAKKVMIPKTVIETQLKSRIVKVTEEREETYTAFVPKPTVDTYHKETCYLDPQVKEKKITTKECKLLPTPISKTFAVNVPQTELRETCPCKASCADCCPEKPCMKCVTRLHRELRNGMIERDQLVFAETTKDIFYCVEMPRKHKEFCFSESYDKLVPVKKTRKVNVCVPKIIREPREVEVVKMLPHVIYCCESCSEKPHAELRQKLHRLVAHKERGKKR